MQNAVGTRIWHQYGAAIDMLADAIERCPDELWSAVVTKDTNDTRYGQFWCVAYHTLYWLDLYLNGAREGFAPPAPFMRRGLPEHPYTKQQILAYLGSCRIKCQTILAALTEEQAERRCVFAWIETSYLELQIYSMRHVQEHAAQLSLVLGQHDVQGLDWIPSATVSAR